MSIPSTALQLRSLVRRSGERFETSQPWDVVVPRLRHFPEPSSFKF